MKFVYLQPMMALLSVLVACIGCGSTSDNGLDGPLRCSELDCDLRHRECLPATDTSYAMCGDCADDAFEHGGACVPLTVCRHDEYELHAATGTRDRQCVKYEVECSSDEYESTPRTDTADRVCSVASTCNADEYEAAPPTDTHDRECLPHTLCSPGETTSVPPSATSDRECEPCDEGFYCPGGAEPPQFCGVLAHDEGPAHPCATIEDIQSERFTCALDSFGRVFCWGPDQPSGYDTWPALTSIAVGSRFLCGLEEDGTPHCVGHYWDGSPVEVPEGLKLQHMVTADNMVCGVGTDADASLECWGTDQLVNQDKTMHSIYVDAVSIGTDHMCIKTTSNTLNCWRRNNATLDTPPDIGTVNLIRASSNYTCATVGTTLRCWRIYNGATLQPNMADRLDAANNTPNVIAMDTAATKLCVIQSDDTLTCWGSTPPTDLGPVQAVATGVFGTCALAEDGFLECWGGTQITQHIPLGFLRSDADSHP